MDAARTIRPADPPQRQLLPVVALRETSPVDLVGDAGAFQISVLVRDGDPPVRVPLDDSRASKPARIVTCRRGDSMMSPGQSQVIGDSADG